MAQSSTTSAQKEVQQILDNAAPPPGTFYNTPMDHTRAAVQVASRKQMALPYNKGHDLDTSMHETRWT
jgi:hypothetical protein